MRVHSAATGADHRAVLAGRAEVSGAALPTGDARVVKNGIEGVPEYVEPGHRCSVVGDLQRVRLLVAPVGLHHDHANRGEPERLGVAVTAREGGDDRVERP